VYVEISARKGHCLTNGHVAQLALATGVKLILNSDAHDSPDLLTQAFAVAVLRGSGLNETESERVLSTNPQALVNGLLASLR
jgi:histidinol phosphatase-like PHP family hydrolase